MCRATSFTGQEQVREWLNEGAVASAQQATASHVAVGHNAGLHETFDLGVQIAGVASLGHGPKPALEDALTGVPGIKQAFIGGSWAARHHGQAGASPTTSTSRPASLNCIAQAV